MRLAFLNAKAAQSAVAVFEDYGYSAVQIGSDVITDCPILLGVPVVDKRVGLSEVERLDLYESPNTFGSMSGSPCTNRHLWTHRGEGDDSAPK